MEKQKITLPIKKWGTIKSKYRPESNDVGNDEFTANSQNFITNNTGAIEKRPTDIIYNTDSFTATPQDQFEAIFSSGVHHLLIMDDGDLKYTTGNRLFSTAATGFTSAGSMEYSMYQNRVYMDNGIDNPQVYDITPAYGGVTYSVPQVKEMGAQPPGSAPTFNADSGGGSVPVGAHTYVVTFLYYGEEESNAGSSSSLHTVLSPDQTVNLKTIPVGGYGVTARNIYRDNGDGNLLLVGTISNNTTTTFTDSVSVGTTPIPSSQDLPPVFSYITLNLSRNWVAGVPGTPSILYWSLPDFPDIFDPNNFIICNPKDPITGLCTFQGLTLVFNRHSFGKIFGSSDDTFYYDEVPGTVGCVDNRSIQIRTIDGVPVLLWLSDRGFYKFDGSSVTYISDPIEDLVNFNLQQVSFTTGSNNQSTQADFQGGTSSPSIDLDSDPNTITVVDPTQVYESEEDWEGGLSLTNVATFDGTNQLKVPVLFAPTLASGSLGGSALISGSSVVLPTISDFTGREATTSAVGCQSPGSTAYATSLSVPLAGTITNFQTAFRASVGITYKVTIWTNVLGLPGAIIYQASSDTTSSGTTTVNKTISFALSGATTYWIGVVLNSASTIRAEELFIDLNGTHQSFGVNGSIKFLNGSVWGNGVSDTQTSGTVAFTFSQTAISDSGTWTSATYDSFSSSAVADIVTNTGTYPTSCSATLYVDASNDSTMSTGITTVSFASPSGTNSVSTTNLRYWRIRYTVSTTNNLRTPSVTVPSLTFNTTGTWISQPIDCTTDVTSYDAITVTDNVPTGTTVVVTVATSTDNITYSSFVSVGSAVVRQYVKVKIVLTATADDASTPSVTFLRFSWQQTSTFISSIIDIGQVPTGWGVFQDQAALNGGTLTFYMRSAASSGAISGATFYAVSNGVFPPTTISPLEFTQWKIIFTSAADSLPSVSGVTVNWFIGTTQSPIRAASLFFNKTYYLSAATLESTYNDIVIAWDFENNWRIFTGVTVNALSLFFNEPFYADGARDNVYQWLIPPTGNGSAISMDVRTKAFDLDNVNTLKNVRSLRVTGINTGTTIHAYYSVDRGTTWIEMLNVNGTTGYATSTDGNKFSQFFVADYSAGAAVSGTTVMYRATSVDAYPCIIMGLEPVLYSRKGNYLGIPV